MTNCGYDAQSMRFIVSRQKVSLEDLRKFYREKFGAQGMGDIVRVAHKEYSNILGERLTLLGSIQNPIEDWIRSFKNNNPPPFVLLVWFAHTHCDGDYVEALKRISEDLCR